MVQARPCRASMGHAGCSKYAYRQPWGPLDTGVIHGAGRTVLQSLHFDFITEILNGQWHCLLTPVGISTPLNRQTSGYNGKEKCFFLYRERTPFQPARIGGHL